MQIPRKPVPGPIERPQSIISTTTNTTINDNDDSLSVVTTPRGGSPLQFDHTTPHSDLPPPSYDESQAAYQEDRFAPGASNSQDVLVFRTEHDRHTYPPPLHPEDTAYGVNDAFTTIDGSQEDAEQQAKPSALLYQALSFTTAPAPVQDENYVAHLTRPVAVPSLPVTLHSSGSTQSPVRFARLYARALQSTSITAAQFASFIDGLNAIAIASRFTASTLHDSSSFRFHPDSDIPQEEFIRAYIQLCNTRFFAPRGLRMHITTLKELLELAKIPERQGFRSSMRDTALNAAISGIGAEGDEASQAAVGAAGALEPYIEPLSGMIPAMHRDSESMQHIATGLANFDIEERDRKVSATTGADVPPRLSDDLARSQTEPQGDEARRKFWSPFGLGPISVGPIVPGMLPPSDRPHPTGRSRTLQEWGDDFGRRMEKWGVQYGRDWEKWGIDYGRAWEDWAKKFHDSQSSASTGLEGRHKEGGVSKESFLTSASKSSGSSQTLGKAKDSNCPWIPNKKTTEEDKDWDDSASDSSSSSEESTDSEDTYVEDPEIAFVAKVAEIEAMADKARETGKKDWRSIEKDRTNALVRAEHDKTAKQIKIEAQFRKREVKRHRRQHKKQMRAWKRSFKQDMKALKRQKAPLTAVKELARQRMDEMHELRKTHEQTSRELGAIRYETREEWRNRRTQRRENKRSRREERRARRLCRMPSSPSTSSESRRGHSHGPGRGWGRRHGHEHPQYHHQMQHNSSASLGPMSPMGIASPHIMLGGMPGHSDSAPRGFPFGGGGPFAGRGGPFGARGGGPFGGRGGPFGGRGGSFGGGRGGPWMRGGFGQAWPEMGVPASEEEYGVTGMPEETPLLKEEDMLWIVIRNLE